MPFIECLFVKTWKMLFVRMPLPNYICPSHQIQQKRHAVGPIVRELHLAGPRRTGLLWPSTYLPPEVRSAPSLHIFWKYLKTYLCFWGWGRGSQRSGKVLRGLPCQSNPLWARCFLTMTVFFKKNIFIVL